MYVHGDSIGACEPRSICVFYLLHSLTSLLNSYSSIYPQVHRAVSRDFVLSVGDEVYFTGSVEEFSPFCDKHGLEALTTENFEKVVETTNNRYP
jgi:hypothetical protein